MSTKHIVAAIYADQNESWDARNADNEIIAVGGGTPVPRIGETLDEWIDRRDKEAATTLEP